MRITAEQAKTEMINAESVIHGVLDDIDTQIAEASKKGLAYIRIGTDEMAVARVVENLRERAFDCTLDAKKENLTISWDGLPF